VIELTIPMEPNLELVAAEAASTIAQLMCFEEDEVDEIRMAMIEACLNAFEHSKSCDRKVYVIFHIREDRLELRVTDHGRGFNPTDVRPPDIKNAVKGGRKRGWGLKLIENLMDEVRIETSGLGTTVIMVKVKA
jgi:serine/threonine-protein kinase RsbW